MGLRQLLTKRKNEAIKKKDKKTLAWSLIELDRLDANMSNQKDTSNSVDFKAELKELEKIDFIADDIEPAEIIGDITSQEKESIIAGIRNRQLTFFTRGRNYEVLGKKDDFFILKLTRNKAFTTLVKVYFIQLPF